MAYTEDYRGVTVTLTQTEKIERHSNGTPDYREIILRATLNCYHISDVVPKYGATLAISMSSDYDQTNTEVIKARDTILPKLHSYIDHILDNSLSAPWL